MWVKTHISLLCQLRAHKSNDTPRAISTPLTRVLVSNTVLEKLMFLGLGQETHSCSWNTVWHEKEGSANQPTNKQTKRPHNDGGVSRGFRSQLDKPQ